MARKRRKGKRATNSDHANTVQEAELVRPLVEAPIPAVNPWRVQFQMRQSQTAGPQGEDLTHDEPPWPLRNIQPIKPLHNAFMSQSPYLLSPGVQVQENGTANPTNELSDNEDDFVSTTSFISKTTFFTAPVPNRLDERPGRLVPDNDYAQLLNKQKLWPVDPSVEQDWSGRGQHAEFERSERDIVNNLLKVQDVLGRTHTATIESVKCRRILLARKTILCSRQFTREDAIAEVSHLTKLSHSHIVRVIGTYVLGRELSILMYPVADYNLEQYLHEARGLPSSGRHKAFSAKAFFVCLSEALRYIHGRLMKHMDIKPQNILVRTSREFSRKDKVYIADFGIARAYDNEKAVETDGWTLYTRRYAAPEVVQQTIRGFPADIFSLGCVFYELYATLKDFWAREEAYLDAIFGSGHDEETRPLEDVKDESCYKALQALTLVGDGTTSSYQMNLERIQKFISVQQRIPLKDFRLDKDDLLILSRMISKDPGERPSAGDLCDHFKNYRYGNPSCCSSQQDPLEASNDTWNQL